MTIFSRYRIGYWLLAGGAIALCGIVLMTTFKREPPPNPIVRAGNEKIDASATVPASGSAPGTKRPPPRNDYVGSSACAECHPKISKQYASHSMGQSMADMASASSLEDYVNQTSFSPDERHIYSVEKKEDGVYHRERLVDANGQTLYDQSVRVDFAVGSGAHGRSYLLERDGMMFMSPISWYSGAQRWNLSPGYKLPTHRRFERRITDNCLDCHVGRVNPVRGWDNHVGKPPFLELSIGCERCHGPAAEHVSFHRDTDPERDVDPIVNPAKLDPPRREDVCAQCHLQGEGRIANFGCEPGDFRPGQRLEDVAVIFVRGTRTTADGMSRAVSHVDQMRSSVCYQKSSGKFGCISCHDPHALPAKAEVNEFYRQKCLACHQSQGCSLPEPERRKQEPNDSCVTCHMPPLGASDIPHTSHTDHRVLRIPSALVTDPFPDNALPEMYDNANQRLPALTVRRARGLWLAERSELKTNPLFAEQALALLAEVVKELPADADVLEAQGTASAVAGRLDDSISFWERALALEPKRELTLRTMALTLQNTNRGAAAIPYFKRYVEIQPWNASMWGRYSFLQGQAGHWKDALDSARKSEAIDPSQSRVHQWLSQVYKKLGDEPQSQYHAELFERIKPPPAK